MSWYKIPQETQLQVFEKLVEIVREEKSELRQDTYAYFNVCQYWADNLKPKILARVHVTGDVDSLRSLSHLPASDRQYVQCIYYDIHLSLDQMIYAIFGFADDEEEEDESGISDAIAAVADTISLWQNTGSQSITLDISVKCDVGFTHGSLVVIEKLFPSQIYLVASQACPGKILLGRQSVCTWAERAINDIARYLPRMHTVQILEETPDNMSSGVTVKCCKRTIRYHNGVRLQDDIEGDS